MQTPHSEITQLLRKWSEGDRDALDQLMPVVHQELRKLADTIQDVMLDVFAAPPRDRYQIITEHDKGHIIVEDTGLGLERSNGIVIIQIFQQGRSTEQKVAVYAELAKRLEAECGVRPEDLIISVMSNRHSDWSFGLGQAQFVAGTLHTPI